MRSKRTGAYVITAQRTLHAVDVVTGERNPTLILSRHAVHTLEKARHDVELELVEYKSRTGEMPGREFILTARSLSESGGTIGPLPDGTVIVVEPIDWRDLATAVGRGDNHSALIAAYNARYA